jgi:hypothetical protein
MSTNLEAMALIAESIRRGVGVTVGDVHLAIGLAMCDQVRQVRPRRAAKTIRTLNRSLLTRRDRSLAAAFPAVYLSSYAGNDVCVMVSHENYAQEDADLYRSILGAFGAPTKVYDQPPPALTREEDTRITVTTPERLARAKSHRAALIVRLSPEATKRVGRGMPGVATLPDL